MDSTSKIHSHYIVDVLPLCPVFGKCGGCLYQNISYPEELKIKEWQLKDLLKECMALPDDVFDAIIPSPQPYNYRNRLDLKLKRTKNKDVFIGFTPVEGRGVVPVEACCIADKNISDFIPELKRQAVERLPAKYRTANLTVRAGDDGRVFWGGIGRRSCQLPQQDYFWTEIAGRRIFYSLDTFFQANLSILPKLFEVISDFPFWSSKPVFYDLYGGVGFFGIGLTGRTKKTILIEDSIPSLKLARHNVDFNQLNNFVIHEERVEDVLPGLLNAESPETAVAMIDPPRAGLSEQACQMIAGLRSLNYIMYLSCSPESLARDLCVFVKEGWEVQKVIPFDFFPKTKHLETLVVLKL